MEEGLPNMASLCEAEAEAGAEAEAIRVGSRGDAAVKQVTKLLLRAPSLESQTPPDEARALAEIADYANTHTYNSKEGMPSATQALHVIRNLAANACCTTLYSTAGSEAVRPGVLVCGVKARLLRCESAFCRLRACSLACVLLSRLARGRCRGRQWRSRIRRWRSLTRCPCGQGQGHSSQK